MQFARMCGVTAPTAVLVAMVSGPVMLNIPLCLFGAFSV